MDVEHVMSPPLSAFSRFLYKNNRNLITRKKYQGNCFLVFPTLVFLRLLLLLLQPQNEKNTVVADLVVELPRFFFSTVRTPYGCVCVCGGLS